jgi:hypothetical protein
MYCPCLTGHFFNPNLHSTFPGFTCIFPFLHCAGLVDTCIDPFFHNITVITCIFSFLHCSGSIDTCIDPFFHYIIMLTCTNLSCLVLSLIVNFVSCTDPALLDHLDMSLPALSSSPWSFSLSFPQLSSSPYSQVCICPFLQSPFPLNHIPSLFLHCHCLPIPLRRSIVTSLILSCISLFSWSAAYALSGIVLAFRWLAYIHSCVSLPSKLKRYELK